MKVQGSTSATSARLRAMPDEPDLGLTLALGLDDAPITVTLDDPTLADENPAEHFTSSLPTTRGVATVGEISERRWTGGAITLEEHHDVLDRERERQIRDTRVRSERMRRQELRELRADLRWAAKHLAPRRQASIRGPSRERRSACNERTQRSRRSRSGSQSRSARARSPGSKSKADPHDADHLGHRRLAGRLR